MSGTTHSSTEPRSLASAKKLVCTRGGVTSRKSRKQNLFQEPNSPRRGLTLPSRFIEFEHSHLGPFYTVPVWTVTRRRKNVNAARDKAETRSRGTVPRPLPSVHNRRSPPSGTKRPLRRKRNGSIWPEAGLCRSNRRNHGVALSWKFPDSLPLNRRILIRRVRNSHARVLRYKLRGLRGSTRGRRPVPIRPYRYRQRIDQPTFSWK